MATKTYNEYEEEQLAKAKKQADEFADQRKAQAEKSAKFSDGVYDSAIESATRNYKATATETEGKYRQVYDANAVSEAVARRNVAEAMANMNLANSGLNATQQTAIAVQRGNADAKTTAQKQAAVDAIMRELDAVISKYVAEKTAAKRNIYSQADSDILSFQQNAETGARQNAISLYNADVEAEAAKYAADQEAATKMSEMLFESQKAQAQERIDMLKLGYSYDESQGKYVYVGTENARIEAAKLEAQTDESPTLQRQNLIVDYMDMGLSRAEAEEVVNEVFGMEPMVSVNDVEKARAMSSNGAPSYTSISANAAMKGKTSESAARSYIRQQYDMGYLTPEQKTELMYLYGGGGLKWAENELMTREEWNNTRHHPNETYESYARQQIQKWNAEHRLEPADSYALMLSRGVVQE